MMLVVLPVDKITAEAQTIFDAGEAVGELRPVLERRELALGERVIVGDVRSAVRLRAYPKTPACFKAMQANCRWIKAK